jgi:branched-chain amino acid aminotransferase
MRKRVGAIDHQQGQLHRHRQTFRHRRPSSSTFFMRASSGELSSPTVTDATIWVDGVLRPYEDATIHVLSHAVQRGSTVFDVMRVVETAEGPAAFGLRPHVARFDRSMHLMGMEPAASIADLERAVAQSVLANPGSNLVKLVATWATTPTGLIPATSVPVLSVAPIVGEITDPNVVAPVRACTATAPKMPPEILPPSLKVAAAYTYGIRHKMKARAEGFDEIILRTPEGQLAESVSQSLFVVTDGGLVLPPLDIVLDGITRRMILDVAHHDGQRAHIRAVDWHEVETADELFLCSTTNPVLPVSELDRRSLPAPGPLTAKLADGAAAVLTGKHDLSARWLTPLKSLL